MKQIIWFREQPSGYTVNFEPGVALVEEGLAFRFTFTARLTTGEDGDAVADIQVVIGAVYSMEEPPEPGSAVAGAFAVDGVFKDIYPFLRQNLHDLTSRIGLPGTIMSSVAPPVSLPVTAAEL